VIRVAASSTHPLGRCTILGVPVAVLMAQVLGKTIGPPPASGRCCTRRW
jgi:hypothetical protein